MDPGVHINHMLLQHNEILGFAYMQSGKSSLSKIAMKFSIRLLTQNYKKISNGFSIEVLIWLIPACHKPLESPFIVYQNFIRCLLIINLCLYLEI